MPASPRASRRARERGSIACQRCRQAKVRCGMSGSPPCRRCEKHGFNCFFDPSYRRINNSDRFEQLESRLSSIAANKSGSPAAPAVGEGLTQSPLPVTASRTSPLSGGDTVSYSIGSVNLSLIQARTLFSIFFEHYHPLLPFLEASRTLEHYYSLSPALFWSIVAVASRQYKGNLELLTRLSPLLGQLIWTDVAVKPMSLAHVQVLLLMSCWPLPDFHLWTDRSLALISTALVAAMHIGLHRPGREAEYSKMRLHISEAARLERTRTWLACVAESQKLSMVFGHLPLAYMNDCTIHQACQDNSRLKVPAALRSNLIIQRCCHYNLQKLTSNYDNPFGLPDQQEMPSVIDGITQEFILLETSLSSDVSYIDVLQLYWGKLFFQCTYFLYDDISTERMNGVLNAFSTASSLLTKLISHPDSHSVLNFAPAKVNHVIFMASMIVLRVLNSSYATLANLDRTAGHVLYSAATISVRQSSVQYKEDDLAIRMAEIMTNLWRWAEEDNVLRDKPPKLLVKSRIGSSIMYDCLIIFRRYQLRRNPDLGELQTGENQDADQLDDQRRGRLFTMGSGTSDLAVGVDDLSADGSQLYPALDVGEVWDLSNMAWVDNFENPSLFDVASL